MTLSDQLEALDAKAGIVEARARKICERRGVNPDKIVDEYGLVLEWHVEAYHISAAVAEIIAALRLAETSSITVLPDGAPSALADRVETSAALDDVAELVERLRRRHAQYVCCTERDAADRIESLSSQLAAAKAGPNILHIGTLLVWRGQTPGTIFIQQADGEGGEFPERDLEAICQSYYAENF